MERTRVTLLGSFITMINSFRTEKGTTEIKEENHEKTLKNYGDERLLKIPETVKAFEKAFGNSDKIPKEFVPKVKTSDKSTNGKGKSMSRVEEAEKQVQEENEIGG